LNANHLSFGAAKPLSVRGNRLPGVPPVGSLRVAAKHQGKIERCSASLRLFRFGPGVVPVSWRVLPDQFEASIVN